jgi:hypothetical protein
MKIGFKSITLLHNITGKKDVFESIVISAFHETDALKH